jgi:hypothetical protein
MQDVSPLGSGGHGVTHGTIHGATHGTSRSNDTGNKHTNTTRSAPFGSQRNKSTDGITAHDRTKPDMTLINEYSARLIMTDDDDDLGIYDAEFMDIGVCDKTVHDSIRPIFTSIGDLFDDEDLI